MAVFDLDQTLIRGDSFKRYLLFTVKRNPASVLRGWYLPFTYLMHVLGLRDNEWLKTRFLSALLAHRKRHDVYEEGRQFASELATEIRKAAIDKMQQHRQIGHYVVLATASPDFYVQAVGASLKFDEVVCTKSRWSAKDTFAGLDGGNCYGEKKHRRVKEALTRLGDAVLTAMYTDHRSDETLLAAAEAAYLVNPDNKTARTVCVAGMEVVDWDSGF